jgi:toxin YoeB
LAEPPSAPSASPARGPAVFQDEFLDDLRCWAETDRVSTRRVLTLIEETLRDPFGGMGKPELLTYFAPDVWSRRITQEHRLVYRVSENCIDFLQARYHY